MSLASPIVWFEIPVKDLAAAEKFYAAVTGAGLKRDDTGPNPMSIFDYAQPGIGGHLYEGNPAPQGTGPTVHLAVEGNVEDAVERLKSAGGTALGPVIEIPAGRFAYGTDPDGNSIGLFTAK